VSLSDVYILNAVTDNDIQLEYILNDIITI